MTAILGMHKLTHSRGEREGLGGCHLAQGGQRVSKERPGFPQRPQGRKRWTKKKAAGWKRRQREGNQTRRGTKEGRAASETAGAGTGSVPEGRRDTASSEKCQGWCKGCLAAGRSPRKGRVL